MRNFGWGLFAMFVAILALVLTVKDDYTSKEKITEYTAQVEALSLPAIVPVIATATPQDRLSENFEFAYCNRATAVHGKGVLAHASRLDCTGCNYTNRYATEFNWSKVTEPTARTGPFSTANALT